MMWRKIRFALCAATLCLWSLASSSCGVCYAAEATYTMTAAELDALATHLDALEQNYVVLTANYRESKEDLTEALNALEASKRELTALRRELETCRDEAEKAKKRLETANEELQLAVKSLKESEAAHAKTEKRLEGQRAFWQIAACLLAGVAIAR